VIEDFLAWLRAFHWEDVVTIVIVVMVIARAFHAIGSYLYVRDVFDGRSETVGEQERLVQRDRVIAWCCGGLAILGTWSLSNFAWPEYVPPIPRPFGTLFIFLVIWVMTRGPIEDRRAWQRLRGER